MRNLAWKLAALAAVVGIVFLVMLQAFRGMNQSTLSKSGDPSTASTTENPANAATAGNATKSDEPKPDTPPHPASPAENGSKVAHDPPVDAHPASPAKGESPTKLADGKGPVAGSDPFAEGDAISHPGAANDKQKTAHPDGPQMRPPSPKSAVTQTSASDGENPLLDPKPSDPAAKSPAGLSAPPTPADPSKPDPAKSDKKDPKAGSGQSEAGGPTQSEPTGDSKSKTGPQLLVPGSADDPPPNGTSARSAPANAGEKINAPSPTNAGGRKQGTDVGNSNANGSQPAGPAFDEGDPSQGLKNTEPVLDSGAPKSPSSDRSADAGPSLMTPDGKDAPKGSANQQKDRSPTLDDKGPPKTAANEQPLPPDRPALFPTDAEKERPLPKKAEPKSDLPGAPRDKSNAHPETPGDFQGDGTINESSAIGPQRPQLSIVKNAPQNALLGEPLVYSIIVRNIGSSEARQVVVEDRVPKGTRLSGTIPQAEMTGKTLLWKLGNLKSGEQRKISIRVVPAEAGEIGSVATVSFVTEAAAGTVVTAPRLQFEISAPASVKLGEMVPFHFTVKNIGTGEARGVVIRNLIPEGLSHGEGSDLQYDVGRLPPGRSKELTLELKAVKVGSTLNRAVATADGGLSAEAKAAIEISGSKVALTRSGPTRRYLGRPTVYSNTIVNESKYPVEGVVVVESVPPGMEFIGATHGGQYNDGTRTVAWRIERMGPAETHVVKSKLVPKSPGTQVCTVRVSVPNGEPVEAKSETMVEGFAALGLKIESVEGPIDLGEQLTFRVNARNNGTIPATNVRVTVEVPDQMEVVSVRGPGMHAQEGNRVRFGPIATLEGQTVAACEITLKARKRGDSRIKVSLSADQVDRPLVREESILILSESPEPTASR